MAFDVITIGTATRDAFVKSKEFHVDPDHHVLGGRGLVMPLGAKIEVKKIHFSTGGGATNAAVTFSRQGFKTSAICVVGEDVSGNTVIDELKKEGAETKFIRKRKGIPTAYSILLHPPGGERTILVYRGAAETLSAKDVSWDGAKTRWFYVSSLAGNTGLLRRILAFAGKRGISVAYNPGGKELRKRRELVPLLKRVNVLILNREEGALLTGINFKKQKEIFGKLNEMSPGINVLSDGPKGAWVSDGRHLYKAGIYKEREVLDRTGAGDAFGSGFVAGIMRGIRNNGFPRKSAARAKRAYGLRSSASSRSELIEYAVKLGSANATSKVEGIGAKHGLLTRKEFETQKRWSYLPIKVGKL